MRITTGIVIGIFVFIGGIWILSKTMGNNRPKYFHGQPLAYWEEQVDAPDATASNQANAMLNAEIIPALTNTLFCDTHDSQIRTNLIEILNGLPGVNYIYYNPAPLRRSMAADDLGNFGPAAGAAIPALIKALQSADADVHEAAIRSLGEIHGDAETVIPLLTKYLDDDNLNDEAATALACYGSQAEAAVPKIIPLLHATDDDAQEAAVAALMKIDPAAYAAATNAPVK